MIWRWKLLFLVVLVLAPTVAYLLVKGKPRIYQSSALVSVNDTTITSGQGNSVSTANLDAIARVVSTSAVANIAAKLLTPPTTAAGIGGSVSASGDQGTGFITITAQARDPRRAAAIANAFAKALGVNRSAVQLGGINNQIGLLQRQLNAIPPGPAGAQGRQQLQQQLSELRAERGGQLTNVAFVEPAAPNSTPVSPHVRRTVELGLVIGFLLGIGAVALAENADRRLRNPSDLEELTRLPLLSAIPSRAFGAPVESVGKEEEAFQMLRAALMYFNIDRRISSVVITSPGQKDGKTTVAIRLALAMSRAGKRVLLIDGDLRRAQVTERLGVKARHGLGGVLIGEERLSDALVEYSVDAPQQGSLTVLPAGPPPPNPSELLSSPQMRELLGGLESTFDLVIIDTPAALAVSDPMPLLPLVSGVVLIARINRSTRESIRRLQRVIAAANGTMLGVVATATGMGPGYEDYDYGYSANGSSRRPIRGWLSRRRRASPSSTPAESKVTAMSQEVRDA